jgi:hypothetical protein
MATAGNGGWVNLGEAISVRCRIKLLRGLRVGVLCG